jgi:hypothetical protein
MQIHEGVGSCAVPRSKYSSANAVIRDIVQKRCQDVFALNVSYVFTVHVCNFIVAHDKSTAFCASIFAKTTSDPQCEMQITYTDFVPKLDNKCGKYTYKLIYALQ